MILMLDFCIRVQFWFDIRRAAIGRNFDVKLVGLHVNHAVEPSTKPRKSLSELAGRRAFSKQTDFQPAVRH
jgi:hypothetical protein